MRTIYHLHTMRDSGYRTTDDRAEALRFLRDGARLAARMGREGTFGRWVLGVVHGKDGRPLASFHLAPEPLMPGPWDDFGWSGDPAGV